MNKIHLFETFDSEDWRGKDWRGHRFFHCNLNHVQIDSSANLYGVEFYSCTANFLECEGFSFSHFTATATDFRHSNFKNTTWANSRLLKCDLTWATFEGADLTNCGADGSDFYLSKIQNAKSVNPFDRDMVSEVMRVEARGDPNILMCAALVKSARDFCWREFKSYTQLPQWKEAASKILSVLEAHPTINLKNKE